MALERAEELNNFKTIRDLAEKNSPELFPRRQEDVAELKTTILLYREFADWLRELDFYRKDYDRRHGYW